MGHDGLTRSPSGLSERRTGFSPRSSARRRPRLSPRPGPSHVRTVRSRRSRVLARRSADALALVTSAVRPTGVPSTGCGARPQVRAALASSRCADEAAGMTSTPLLTAVVGASGGLGASTLALAVGRRLAATGPPAVVVDLDLLRGGLEVTAGVEHLPGRRWDDLRHVRGRVPPDALVSVLPGEEGCAVLSARGGAPPGVPEDGGARRRRLPGRGLGPGGARPAARPVRCSRVCCPAGALVVLVVGLRTRALADADAAVSRLLDEPGAPDAAPDLRLVTRGGRAGVRRRRRGRRAPRRRPPAPPPRRPARAPRRRARAVPRHRSRRRAAVRGCRGGGGRRGRGGVVSARAGPLDASVRRAIRAGSPPSADGDRRAWSPSTRRPWATTAGCWRPVTCSSSWSAWGRSPRWPPTPSVTDLLVNGDGVVWVDRGRGVERAAVRVARRRPAAAGRPPRRGGGSAARRRPALGRRGAAGRGAAARRAAAARRRRAAPEPALRAAPTRRGRRPGRAGGRHARHGCAAARGRRGARLARGDRWHGGGQDHRARGAGGRVPAPTSGSSSSRTSASSTPTIPTWCGCRGAGPTSRVSEGSPSSTWSARRCGCDPTASSSARCAAPEVRELLAALNTGHEGGMSTLHANGPDEVPARIEALGALAGMPREAVHAQLREALRVVVHVVRRGGHRFVDRVGVVVADPTEPGRRRAGGRGGVERRAGPGRRARAATGWCSWCPAVAERAAGWSRADGRASWSCSPACSGRGAPGRPVVRAGRRHAGRRPGGRAHRVPGRLGRLRAGPRSAGGSTRSGRAAGSPTSPRWSPSGSRPGSTCPRRPWPPRVRRRCWPGLRGSPVTWRARPTRGRGVDDAARGRARRHGRRAT